MNFKNSNIYELIGKISSYSLNDTISFNKALKELV